MVRPEPADRRPLDHHRGRCPAHSSPTPASFPRSAGRRRTGAACRRSPALLPPDRSRTLRLASRPSSRRMARLPRCTHSPSRAAASRTAARTGSLLFGPEVGGRPRPVAVEQAAHLGREQHRRAAGPRLRDRLDQRLAVAGRIDPGLRLEQRDPAHAASRESSCPLTLEREQVVAAADMLARR